MRVHKSWALTLTVLVFRLSNVDGRKVQFLQSCWTEVGWVIGQAERSEGPPDPKNPADTARCSRGLELRKQWSHQGLWRYMHPRCWLPRRSWRL